MVLIIIKSIMYAERVVRRLLFHHQKRWGLLNHSVVGLALIIVKRGELG